MLRRYRKPTILALIATGAFVTQLGGCFSGLAGNVLAAIDFCSILGPDCVLGPIAPCGDPNTTADDILLDCPRPTVTAS